VKRLKAQGNGLILNLKQMQPPKYVYPVTPEKASLQLWKLCGHSSPEACVKYVQENQEEIRSRVQKYHTMKDF